MNELTVEEYLENRQQYREHGRASEGSVAQQAARDKAYADKIAELQKSGVPIEEAESQAQEWLKTQNALPNPDQVAGGRYDNIGGLGDSRINNSIGSQWRSRIKEIDEQIAKIAETMTDAEKKSTYLNVTLILKGGS